MDSLLGAKMLFLIRLAWEASEIQFSSVSFDQSCFNRFYLSWPLGSGFGSAWLGARLSWAPDGCSARLRARFVSQLGTQGL